MSIEPKTAGETIDSLPIPSDKSDIHGETVDVEEPVAITGKGRFDIAAEFLKLHEGEHGEYTQKEARRVLWKIDLMMIPLMTGSVILNSTDVSLFAYPSKHSSWS